MKIGKMLIAGIIGMMALVSTARADSATASGHASEDISRAAGAVVSGSADLLAASGELTVVSAEAAGEALVVVLKGSAEAGTVVLRISGEAARGVVLAAGSVVEVVAQAVGYAMVAAGRTIAFIPNDTGRALLHHSRDRNGR